MHTRLGLLLGISLAGGCFDPADADVAGTEGASSSSATETGAVTSGSPGTTMEETSSTQTASDGTTSATGDTTDPTTPTSTGDDAETTEADGTTGSGAGCADPEASPGCNDGMVAEGDVCFAATPDLIRPGDGPQMLAVGHIDNDEHLDVVVTDTVDNVIRIFRGNGSGGFAAPTMLPVAQPRGITLGAVNGDSNIDLVVLANAGASARAYAGDGTGAFSFIDEETVHPNAVATDVGVADLDNDGDGDVVVPLWDEIAVIFGTGTAFNPPTYTALAPSTEGAFHVALAPMAGSSIDVVSSFYDSVNVGVFLNSGNGTLTFDGATEIGVGSDGANAIALGDFNADGWPDVVASVDANSQVYVLLNDGEGGLIEDVGPLGADATAVATGDFSGDCIDDLAMVRRSGASYEAAFYRGLGNGEFAAPVVVEVAGMVHDLELGDFNGDGLADALLTFTGGGSTGISIIVSQP